MHLVQLNRRIQIESFDSKCRERISTKDTWIQVCGKTAPSCQMRFMILYGKLIKTWPQQYYDEEAIMPQKVGPN